MPHLQLYSCHLSGKARADSFFLDCKGPQPWPLHLLQGPVGAFLQEQGPQDPPPWLDSACLCNGEQHGCIGAELRPWCDGASRCASRAWLLLGCELGVSAWRCTTLRRGASLPGTRSGTSAPCSIPCCRCALSPFHISCFFKMKLRGVSGSTPDCEASR